MRLPLAALVAALALLAACSSPAKDVAWMAVGELPDDDAWELY